MRLGVVMKRNLSGGDDDKRSPMDAEQMERRPGDERGAQGTCKSLEPQLVWLGWASSWAHSSCLRKDQ